MWSTGGTGLDMSRTSSQFYFWMGLTFSIKMNSIVKQSLFGDGVECAAILYQDTQHTGHSRVSHRRGRRALKFVTCFITLHQSSQGLFLWHLYREVRSVVWNEYDNILLLAWFLTKFYPLLVGFRENWETKLLSLLLLLWNYSLVKVG